MQIRGGVRPAHAGVCDESLSGGGAVRGVAVRLCACASLCVCCSALMLCLWLLMDIRNYNRQRLSPPVGGSTGPPRVAQHLDREA